MAKIRRRNISPRSRQKIEKKDLLNFFLVLVLMTLAVSLVMFGISIWERNRYATPGGESNVYIEPVIRQPKRVTVDGVDYVQKMEIETYYLMGIDVDEDYTGVYGGQNDVNLLLVIDNDAKTWRILQLNRDSMVDVQVINDTGSIVGTQYQQLALAHSYGSGGRDSCLNAMDTVRALLWDQPIDGFAALQMDGIAVLNDAAGGVDVVIPEEYALLDDRYQAGEEVHLMGNDAMKFIRRRSMTADDANLDRMARQRTYLNSFVKQFANLTESDILKAYEDSYRYMVTSIGSGVMLKIADKAQTYTELPLMTVEGTLSVPEVFVEYELDQDSLQQAILELFYEQEGKA